MAQQEHKVGQRLLHMWNCLKLSNDGVGNVNGSNYPWHNRGLNPDRGCCCLGLGLQGVCGASPRGWGQQWPPLWEMCPDKALTCHKVVAVEGSEQTAYHQRQVMVSGDSLLQETEASMC